MSNGGASIPWTLDYDGDKAQVPRVDAEIIIERADGSHCTIPFELGNGDRARLQMKACGLPHGAEVQMGDRWITVAFDGESKP